MTYRQYITGLSCTLYLLDTFTTIIMKFINKIPSSNYYDCLANTRILGPPRQNAFFLWKLVDEFLQFKQVYFIVIAKLFTFKNY